MTTPVIAQELGLIKGIKIFGKPQVSVVAFGSDETNIFGISDTLKNKVFIVTLISSSVNPIQQDLTPGNALCCRVGT